MVSGKRPLVEDDLRWKTTCVGRRPLVEDDLQRRQPLIEEDLQWKTTFCSQLLFRAFVQIFVHMFFPTFTRNSCSQLLFKSFDHNFIHNPCSHFCLQHFFWQLLWKILIHNCSSKILFITIIQDFCSQFTVINLCNS